MVELLIMTKQHLSFVRLNDAAALVKHQRYVSFLVSLAFFGLFVTVCLLVWQLWPRV